MTTIRHIGRLVFGIICLVVGAITLPMPLPTGLVLLAIGILTLAPIFPPFRKFIFWLLRKFPELAKKVRELRINHRKKRKQQLKLAGKKRQPQQKGRQVDIESKAA